MTDEPGTGWQAVGISGAARGLGAELVREVSGSIPVVTVLWLDR